MDGTRRCLLAAFALHRWSPVNPRVPGQARRWCADRYEAATTCLFAARGLAMLRIGYGTLWVLFLLREWGERDAAWGPDSAWSPALERQYATQSGWSGLERSWLTALGGLTRTEFDLFYLAAIALGIAFALGWHTRATSILFAIVVLALENRSPLLSDGGDNVLSLMSIYLAFTACGTHCSLDARRRAARAADPAQAESTRPDWLTELAAVRQRTVVLAHNGAVLAVAAQMCVIYGTAGFLKVQGSMWQNGSALAYVLQLNWFHPWPTLSAWVAGHTLPLALAGYTTVFAQAGFPFIVFAPKLKYPTLALLVLMHLSIAVLLGLPFFSAIMLVGDAIFLPDRFWQAATRRANTMLRRATLTWRRYRTTAPGRQSAAEDREPIGTPAGGGRTSRAARASAVTVRAPRTSGRRS